MVYGSNVIHYVIWSTPIQVGLETLILRSMHAAVHMKHDPVMVLFTHRLPDANCCELFKNIARGKLLLLIRHWGMQDHCSAEAQGENATRMRPHESC